MSRPRPQSGFSLLEMAIVVAVILSLAAIAIPRFLRAKDAASQAAAVSTMQTINRAQTLHFTLYENYAPNVPLLFSHVSTVGNPFLQCVQQPCAKGDYGFLTGPQADFIMGADAALGRSYVTLALPRIPDRIPSLCMLNGATAQVDACGVGMGKSR